MKKERMQRNKEFGFFTKPSKMEFFLRTGITPFGNLSEIPSAGCSKINRTHWYTSGLKCPVGEN
jgi:hypothetical protein